jgi:thiamine pyrophosphate-dependent acetolactate synthase large subunit-like protein
VGQPLRCWHDGANRLLIGLLAMLDCDVLLMLGTDFPYRQFYPRGPGCGSRKSI